MRPPLPHPEPAAPNGPVRKPALVRLAAGLVLAFAGIMFLPAEGESPALAIFLIMLGIVFTGSGLACSIGPRPRHLTKPQSPPPKPGATRSKATEPLRR